MAVVYNIFRVLRHRHYNIMQRVPIITYNIAILQFIISIITGPRMNQLNQPTKFNVKMSKL